MKGVTKEKVDDLRMDARCLLNGRGLDVGESQSKYSRNPLPHFFPLLVPPPRLLSMFVFLERGTFNYFVVLMAWLMVFVASPFLMLRK